MSERRKNAMPMIEVSEQEYITPVEKILWNINERLVEMQKGISALTGLIVLAAAPQTALQKACADMKAKIEVGNQPAEESGGGADTPSETLPDKPQEKTGAPAVPKGTCKYCGAVCEGPGAVMKHYYAAHPEEMKKKG
jgi:hypothetical protein